MNCVCVCVWWEISVYILKKNPSKATVLHEKFIHSTTLWSRAVIDEEEVTKITMMKMIFRQRVSQNLAVWTIKNPQLVIKFDSKSHAWRHFPPCPPLPFSPFLFYPNVNIFCHVSMLASYSDSEPKVLRFWSHTAIKDEPRDFSSF